MYNESIMSFPKIKVERAFEYGFLAIFVVLSIGIPLVFTPLTRSVFEVNKLLLLRICSILAGGLWLFKTVLYRHNEIKESGTKTFLGIPWKPTRLEVPLVLWVISSSLSTLFSQNLHISIFGSYDRWEGFITVSNYIFLFIIFAKLVTTHRQLVWISTATLITVAISGTYGVIQSLGYDMINWSLDPSLRVFACINNPVHYCAYLGMIVPLGVGTNLFLIRSKKHIEILPIILLALAISALYYFNVHISYFEFNWWMFGMKVALLISGIAVYMANPKFEKTAMILLALSSALFFYVYYFVSNTVQTTAAIWLPFLTVGCLIFLVTSLYFTKHQKPIAYLNVKLCIFALTALAYYNQYLSYSRATWLGFLAAMTLFYLVVTHFINTKKEKSFIWDFLSISALIAVFYLFFLFRLHQFSLSLGIIIFSALGILTLISVYLLPGQNETPSDSPPLLQLALTSLMIGITYVNCILPYVSDRSFPVWLHILLSIMMTGLSSLLNQKGRLFAGRWVTILLFAQLQFVALSPKHWVIFASLCISFYLLCLQKNEIISKEKRIWLVSYAVLFAVILVLPALPQYFIADNDSDTFKILKNVNEKISSYESIALEGSARTSMWKSSIPWIKDYWLIGSGLDTVKFMYPDYRRPDYGILEGGHNFTPDRLHNEYLNTLATKGVFGFIAYYVLFIGGWLILVLSGYFRIRHTPTAYLLLACLAGSFVYLGQVMFNFGVVATLFLFYALMGLCTAIVNNGIEVDS